MNRISDPRQSIIDRLRKLLTAIEFELMEGEPNETEILRLTDEIACANGELQERSLHGTD